jgi:hypothetical protein
MASQGQPSHMDATRSYVTARTEFTNDTKSYASQMQMAQPQPAPLPAFYRICGCIECYNPPREVLEYDYLYDDTNGKKPPQNYPRIRERGEYYIDSYNGEAWSCSFGTNEKVRKRTKKCQCLLTPVEEEGSHSDFCFLPRLEWSLVQQLGSSWIHHVRACVAITDVFGCHCHPLDSHRRNSCRLGHGLQRLVFYGSGLSRQDFLDGSWKCAFGRYSFGTSTAHEGFSLHVRTMSDLQTPHVSSLSNLQSLHQSNGPSLSMDEQLCGGQQLEALSSLSLVHLDVCRLFLGLVWLELLFLRG